MHLTADGDLVIAQRKCGNECLFLPIVIGEHRAVVLLARSFQHLRKKFQVFLRFCVCPQRNADMEQSLILAVQITEELFNVLDIHLDRRRQNVGIIAGLRSLFLFVDLHLLHIGELLFDEFQGIYLVQRFYMNVHAEKILHFKEVLKYLIGQLSGKDIHTPHSAVGIADLKVCLIEFERGRTDEVLCVHSCPQHFSPIEKKWGISVRVQGIIQSFKSLFAVKQFRFDTKGFETLDNIIQGGKGKAHVYQE